MATITCHNLKNGRKSYTIQVKTKNGFKSTTWKRPVDMKENEFKRTIELLKVEFERKVRSEIDVKNLNITFSECADQWLEFIYSSKSKSHYYNSLKIVEELKQKFGNKILKSICLRQIENYFIQLNNKEITKNNVRLIKSLDEVIKDKKIKDICSKCGFTKTTFQFVRKNKPIDIKTADAICKCFNLNFKEYFENTKIVKKYELETKLKYKRVLSAILQYAVKHEYIEKNYASSVFIGKLISGEKKEKEVLTEEETKLFNIALDNEQNLKIRLALTILLYMGLRIGELSGLEWKDIDFQNRTMKIERSICFIPHFGEYVKPPKTSKSKRKLDLPNKVYDLLLEYKIQYDKEKIRLGNIWIDKDKVINSWNGDTTTPTTYNNWLTNILISNGIRKVSPHSLRHTCITTLLRNNIPPQIVANWAGHSSPTLTLNTYAHFLPEDKNICANKINIVFN